MAGVLWHVNSGECSLVAATAKTIIQVKAPTNQRLILRALRFFGKQAAGGTDTPCKIRLTRSTANFGTGSAATAAKNDPNDGETLQAVCAANFTVEPTTPADGGLWWELQPQTGIIEPLAPGQEIKIPGAAAANFEFTSPATPSVMTEVTGEE
jgi:hypothetical protein